MLEKEERTWGTLAHVIPLALYLTTTFGWVAALILYLAYKDKSKFVAYHALQMLLFIFGMWVLALVGVILFFTVIGIPLAIVFWIIAGIGGIVWPIVAAFKANAGLWYEYPIVGKIARGIVN